MTFDFDKPEWLLAEVLVCVRDHGLTQATLAQRISRGLVKPEAETVQGRATLYTGHDVIQIALQHELTQQGILMQAALDIWRVVRDRIVERSTKESKERLAAILHVDPRRTVKLLFADERKFSLADLDGDGGPAVRAVLRIDHFIDEMVGRMESISKTREDYDPELKLRKRALAGEALPSGRKVKDIPPPPVLPWHKPRGS